MWGQSINPALTQMFDRTSALTPSEGPAIRMQRRMQGTAAAQQVSTGLTCRPSCLKRKRGPLSCRAAASNGARQTTIHKLIEEHGNLIVPGIYDALSARICSRQGAKVAFLSGYAVRQ